jgi:hypothetical protein
MRDREGEGERDGWLGEIGKLAGGRQDGWVFGVYGSVYVWHLAHTYITAAVIFIIQIQVKSR